MFKNISKYSYFTFIPFILLGFFTITLFALSIIPVWYLMFTFIGWVLIAGLGVSVGYHKIFSHKNYRDIPLWKENIILFLGTLSGQGSSITWTAVHRGYHHNCSDTINDIHSPIHGKWYAFFSWTLKVTEQSNIINMRYAIDLLRKSNHVWMHKNQLRVLWGTVFLLALVDWKLSLALLCLPAAISLFVDNLINVYCHVDTFMSYRNFNTNDNSQNNIALGLLGWGLGWHNNHHAQQTTFDFGTGISGKWWEYDPTRIFKPFLE